MQVRRQFHHYFQRSDSLKLFYDVITTISTCVYRDIVVIPFIFLTTEDFVKGWRYKSSWGRVQPVDASSVYYHTLSI